MESPGKSFIHHRFQFCEERGLVVLGIAEGVGGSQETEIPIPVYVAPIIVRTHHVDQPLVGKLPETAGGGVPIRPLRKVIPQMHGNGSIVLSKRISHRINNIPPFHRGHLPLDEFCVYWADDLPRIAVTAHFIRGATFPIPELRADRHAYASAEFLPVMGNNQTDGRYIPSGVN